MCGRYTLTNPGDLLDEVLEELHVDADDAPSLEPRFNIAPTQAVPVVRESGRGEGRELRLMHWGLVPFWADDPSIGNRMINARSETASSKPSFRAAFGRRRCLFLVDGFYEWVKQEEGPKQPYHIHRPDRRPFTFAGLWELWNRDGEKDPTRGPLESCTILTTAASDAMEPYHHRMPVILDGDARDAWLADDAPKPALEEMLGPYDGALEFTPVSRMVNNPRNEAPGCVQPITRME